ncbi:MAG: substrate-binding domain-containing protein, partial [Nitriliruptoraceae bacterium]
QVGLAAPSDLAAGWVDDALTGRIPVIQREAGAGSQIAFEQAVAAYGSADSSRAAVGPRASGHAEAAWRCATDGLVAVTIEPCALAMGLAFHPLELHVSELWIGVDHIDHSSVRAFMDGLTGDRVQRRLDAVGGYDLTDCGTPIAA